MALMECFVEDLLSINMIQSGAFNLKPVNFELTEVLDFIKMTFEQKFMQKNLQLSVEYVKRLESKES